MSELKKSMVRKRSSKRLSRKKLLSETHGMDWEDDELPVGLVVPQRVFLYIQLDEIKNLPVSKYPLELHLFQAKNTLQKMQEVYTTETIIYEHEFQLHRPTFTMTVVQDSVDDMNLFSDNPLVITLYQHVPRRPKYALSKAQTGLPGDIAQSETNIPATTDGLMKSMTSISSSTYNMVDADGEEEEVEMEEEHLEFQSRGVCDLLQIFHRKRFISSVEIYLYPHYQLTVSEDETQKLTTTVTVWHMYSILPILKSITFTNLAFLTLESIYNVVDEELINNALDLVVRVSFRSTYPNELGEYHVVPLCDYQGLTHQIISEQHTSVVWETLKRDQHPAAEFSYTQIEANTKIKLPKIFRFLLFTEGVDFHLEDINALVDHALINNSLHRYVLNNELRALLEEAAVHDTYKLLMEIYIKEQPEKILYEGDANLSVFAYPNVKWVHYAIELRRPLVRKLSTISVASSKRAAPGNSRKQLANKEEKNIVIESPEIPMFATFKICLFESITERNEPLDYYNEDVKKRCKLRRCFFMGECELEPEGNIVKEFYRIFDEYITDIINFLIKHNVHSFTEQQAFLCCQMNNLTNIVLKICGSDFNVRMPTSTNIEFRKMLTHMYKELMDRVYLLVRRCGVDRSEMDAEKNKTIRLMSEYKLLNLIEGVPHVQEFFQALVDVTKNRKLISFFSFINDLENLRVRKANKYAKLEVDCREIDVDYFIQLTGLYTNYKLELRNELTANDAFSNLLEELRKFTNINALDRDVLILIYCYYKGCNYLPGIEYMRMRYENLYFVPGKSLCKLPTALYEFYIDFDPEIPNSNRRACAFYETFKLFVQLGLYDFADLVFSEIQTDIHPIEAYLITNTLNMLRKCVDQNFVLRKMQTDKTPHGLRMKQFLIHIHGNLEYERNNKIAAMQYFKELLDISPDDELAKSFKLSYFRLGYYAMEEKEFELALKAFQLSLPSDMQEKNCMFNYAVGKAKYNLGQISEAIEYFAKCTEAELHSPDAWAYLAVINLRLGQNKTALECWKMAKLYPELKLPEEIYDELQKIDHLHINLVVE